MKTLLSILIFAATATASAQINQKTVTLRKQYPLTPSFQFEQLPMQMDFEKNFASGQNKIPTINILSTERFPKPSTNSIQKAFNYYNSLKKPVDFSGFIMMGYSMMSNQPILNTAPTEGLRFSPGNVKN
jgi:hypothetical protein